MCFLSRPNPAVKRRLVCFTYAAYGDFGGVGCSVNMKRIAATLDIKGKVRAYQSSSSLVLSLISTRVAIKFRSVF